MPKKFGKHELIREIGRGGMGVVYEARETGTGRTVALKVITERLSKIEKAVRRFEREAEAAARLQHPNFVLVYELGRNDERDYIAMEFVRGKTLSERIREAGPLDIAEAIEITRQVAGALAAAHQENIIHRDIKPQNIMIDGESRARVMDFGLAKLQDALTQLTKTGAKIGTPAYMPPEQVRGEAVDARSDIYSLGATLYEMLTGHPPFTGSSLWETLALVLEAPFPDAGQSRPDLPESLAAVLRRMTAKNPEDRYASAQEVASVLEQPAPVIKTAEKTPSLGLLPANALWGNTEALEENLPATPDTPLEVSPADATQHADPPQKREAWKKQMTALPQAGWESVKKLFDRMAIALQKWRTQIAPFSLACWALAKKILDHTGTAFEKWKKQIAIGALGILWSAGILAFLEMTMGGGVLVFILCLIYFRHAPKARTVLERNVLALGGPPAICLVCAGTLWSLRHFHYHLPAAGAISLASVVIFFSIRDMLIAPGAILRNKIQNALLFLGIAPGVCLWAWAFFDMVGRLEKFSVPILVGYLIYLFYLKQSWSGKGSVGKILLNLYVPAGVWFMAQFFF